MGNAQLQAERSRGFHPRRCGSYDAITPEQVLRHHRSAQGRHGETGSCPLLYLYQHPEFHIHGKGILQSRLSIIFYASVRYGRLPCLHLIRLRCQTSFSHSVQRSQEWGKLNSSLKDFFQFCRGPFYNGRLPLFELLLLLI